jgi:hypothetical protein
MVTGAKTSHLVRNRIVIDNEDLNPMPEPVLPVISKHSYGVNVSEMTKPFTMKTCPDITNQYLCPFVKCHCKKVHMLSSMVLSNQ